MRELKHLKKANQGHSQQLFQKAEDKPKDFFGVQAKLEMGQPGDQYEQEADAMADQVVNQPSSSVDLIQKQGSEEEEVQQKPLADSISRVQKQEMAEEEPVQAKCAECEKEESLQQKPAEEEEPLQKQEEEEQVQSKTGTSAMPPQETGSIEGPLSQSKGSGTMMDKTSKQEMENGFGADFSKVRIHTDARAHEMSDRIGAQAFTHGNDIYFNSGKYQPESLKGRHLLAHELTHTIQQKGAVQKKLQKKIGDGHDLKAQRFAGNAKLEAAFDDEQHIRNGSSGGHVKSLQLALMDIGYELPKFGADGIFGSETDSAVKEFQKEFSLLVDGIVGPETMGTLDNVFSSENTEEIIDFDDDSGADVLDGDSGQGPTVPTQEKSINQMLAGDFDTVSEIQTAPLENPPEKVKPPSISKITINLTNQNLKILWSNGKTRGPYDISSGKGCPNTKGDPCIDPKRGDKDTYCTPVGSNFKAEKLGGEDYKSAAGDAMSWYMAFVTERGIGIHNAQAVTGTPKSHGCVRVVESVAELIHNNVTKSSTIVVTGKAATSAWSLSKKKAAKSYKGCPGKKAK
ncbi:hypothetical protein GCM10028791_02020 [Echinicola sediminis]